jgi:hypothetical protein
MKTQQVISNDHIEPCGNGNSKLRGWMGTAHWAAHVADFLISFRQYSEVSQFSANSCIRLEGFVSYKSLNQAKLQRA